MEKPDNAPDILTGEVYGL